MRVARAVFMLSVLWSPAAMAEAAGPFDCNDVINRAAVPEVPIYDDWNGRLVGKLPGAHIVPGLKVESCAPNRRMRVTIRERTVWIDSFSVETNRTNVPALKQFAPRKPDSAGHRAEAPKRNNKSGPVLVLVSADVPPMPPERPRVNILATRPTTPVDDPARSERAGDDRRARALEANERAREASRRARALDEIRKEQTAQREFVMPISIGQFGDWGAYRVDTGKDPTCYAVVRPAKRSGPANPARDNTYLFVTAQPAGAKYEVALQAGESFKADAPATIELGATKVVLLTRDDNAWIDNEGLQAALVDAMRKGAGVTVKGTSQAGSPTAATFPLKGFGQALDTITKQCR